MGLIEFILLCVVVGVIVWAVNTYTPIPQPIKTLILVVAILVLVLVLVRAIGFDMRIPSLR
jgi:hypothetical protein